MAEELFFPPIGPDVGVGQEYTADNGVTYTWRPEYSTWMIGSSQQVNKDYVDSRDQLRLRVDGYNHMYGDLVFRQTADNLSDVVVELTQGGTLNLNGNKRLNFVGDGGAISVSGARFLEFKNSQVHVNKTIYYDNNLQNYHQSNTSKNVTLYENQSSSSTTTSILMSKGSSSKITLKASGSNYGLTINNNGSVQVNSLSKTAFDVNNGDFVVDGSNKRIYTSAEYDKELTESVGSITQWESNAVATKGYVDANSAVPGAAIVAQSEADAEVNGFWRSGNNLYLRVS